MNFKSPRAGLSHGYIVAGMALLGGALVVASSVALWNARRAANIAAQAKDYLRERNVQPLAADWQSKPSELAIESLPHPLFGNAAPAFELSDSHSVRQSLAQHVTSGPVILVFYYGYYCNHCVAQLFALQADLAEFQKRGATVIAISPDSPAETRAKFTKYGEFGFPVLADPAIQTAAAYSLVRPSAAGESDRLLHGTFIIDRAGIVRWCHYGEAPFTDNAALLSAISAH